MKAPLLIFTNTDFNVLTDHPEVIKHMCSVILVPRNTKCTHYSIGPNKEGYDTLTLYCSESAGANMLPFPMENADEIASFISLWCRMVAKYKDVGGGVGHMEPGVRLRNSSNWKVLVEASAEYVYYGK